jgi:hypothetical protein
MMLKSDNVASHIQYEEDSSDLKMEGDVYQNDTYQHYYPQQPQWVPYDMQYQHPQ